MGNIFKKIFSLTRDNESKPDFQTCCTPMEIFDEQKVKAIVKHWLLSIDEYETIPDDIVALNFNLWEAVEEDGDRKSTRLNSSHYQQSRMPSSA